MKVLLVNHESLTHMSGAEKFIIRLGKGLRRRGIDVEVSALPLNRDRGKEGVVRELLGDIPYSECWVCRDEDYDVVYVNYAPLVWRLQLLRIKAPKIAGIHGAVLIPQYQHPDLQRLDFIDFINYLGFKQYLAYKTFKYFGEGDIKRFNAIHIPNPNIKLKLGVPEYNIPNWVDDSYFKSEVIKDEEFIVLYVGRLSWEKGIDVVRKVVRVMETKNPNIKFAIPEKLPFKNVITYDFLSEEELIEMYGRASVVIYPSRTDVFSLVIIESLATGTPVVTSDIPTHQGYPKECVKYAATTTEYMNHILALYELRTSNEDKYLKLTDHCRKYAMTHFNEERAINGFIRMFEEVSAGSK